jgi:hypothetical protein
MRNREEDYSDDEEDLEEDEKDEPKEQKMIRPIQKNDAPKQQQVIIEREITLSLINDKLNAIINLLQNKN